MKYKIEVPHQQGGKRTEGREKQRRAGSHRERYRAYLFIRWTYVRYIV